MLLEAYDADRVKSGTTIFAGEDGRIGGDRAARATAEFAQAPGGMLSVLLQS